MDAEYQPRVVVWYDHVTGKPVTLGLPSTPAPARRYSRSGKVVGSRSENGTFVYSVLFDDGKYSGWLYLDELNRAGDSDL